MGLITFDDSGTVNVPHARKCSSSGPTTTYLSAMASRGSFAPLRAAPFRRFYVAKLVDSSGSMMAPVALAFAVLGISDSPTALGVVLAANMTPLVLFLLFGGVLADRLPRLPLLRWGSLVAGLTQGTVAWLVITGRAELWMLIVLEAVNGLVLAVVMPTLEGLFPQLVPRGLLQEANLLMSLARNGLRVIAPTVSALLVVGVGPGWALAVDAVTFVVAAALLLRVSVPAGSPRERSSLLADLRTGWKVFTGHTWLWVVVLAFSAANAIVAGAWMTLGPAQAKQTIGEQGWGYVLSAESAGLLVMVLVMMRHRLERPLLRGMLAVSLSGVPIALLGLTDQLLVLLVAAFVGGAGIELFALGWQLAMQENIEPDKLSRAYSYDMLGSYVAMPVGQLAFGPLAVRFGMERVLVVSGITYVVVCLLALLSGQVRRLERVEVPLVGDLGGA